MQHGTAPGKTGGGFFLPNMTDPSAQAQKQPGGGMFLFVFLQSRQCHGNLAASFVAAATEGTGAGPNPVFLFGGDGPGSIYGPAVAADKLLFHQPSSVMQ